MFDDASHIVQVRNDEMTPIRVMVPSLRGRSRKWVSVQSALPLPCVHSPVCSSIQGVLAAMQRALSQIESDHRTRFACAPSPHSSTSTKGPTSSIDETSQAVFAFPRTGGASARLRPPGTTRFRPPSRSRRAFVVASRTVTICGLSSLVFGFLSCESRPHPFTLFRKMDDRIGRPAT